MARKEGSISKESKVKLDIIKFMLSKTGSFKEPEIIKHLEEKYNKRVDQGNINRHLHGLERLSCIKIFPAEKKGLPNYWDINKLEHLRNILNKFEDIELLRCEKALSIFIIDRTLKDNLFSLDFPHAIKYKTMLCLSDTFLGDCVNEDMETIYFKGYNLYKHKNGSIEYLEYKKLLNIVYNEFMERISKDLNIMLTAAYNKYINNSSNLEFSINNLKCLHSIKISEETFQEMLEDIPFEDDDRSIEEHHLRYVKEISGKIAHEIAQKILGEMPEDIQKNQEEMLKIISEDIYGILVKENSEALFHKIDELGYYLAFRTELGLNTWFAYCTEGDIAKGKASDLEKEFIDELNSEQTRFAKTFPEFHEQNRNYPMSLIRPLDEFYDRYMKRYREGSVEIL